MTAPGVAVASLGRIAGQAYSGEGTSQAAAIASAAAALVWSKYPTLTAEQLLTRLLATTDHHETTHNNAYGYGIVNPERAIDSTQPTAKTNPVYAAAAPFIKRAQALLAQGNQSGPYPAVRKPNPPGTFRVGSPPSRFDSSVIGGSAVALAGVLTLMVLAVTGTRRHRRRNAALAAARAAAQPPPPAPPTIDADGVEWHHL
jgi:subtilisin family serine protease